MTSFKNSSHFKTRHLTNKAIADIGYCLKLRNCFVLNFQKPRNEFPEFVTYLASKMLNSSLNKTKYDIFTVMYEGCQVYGEKKPVEYVNVKKLKENCNKYAFSMSYFKNAGRNIFHESDATIVGKLLKVFILG